MIKLTRPEINSLILNYFKQESFIYSAFVFKNEIKEEVKSIRKDISLDKLLTYGLQYMYGIEHYKDGKIITCNGVYSLDRLHLCDVVVKRKKKKEKGNDEKNTFLSNEENQKIKKEEDKLCERREKVEKKRLEQEGIKNLVADFSPPTSPITLHFSVKSLAPCKPCQYATLYDEYLYLYASSSLYTFKFGSFVGVKSLELTNILYIDDILIMYDGSKLVFYNTFNLKSKSVLHKCLKILYDGTKFVCLNLDGTISYFSRDGTKVMENIFIFSGIVSGCIEENTLLVWNEEGKVCMINTKTQKMFHFNRRGRTKAYSYFEGILYLISNDGTVNIYNTLTQSESEIPLSCIIGLCKTQKFLLGFKENILSIYHNNNDCYKFNTKMNITKIVNLKRKILIIFITTISFYDENLQLIKHYDCEDDIMDIEIYENEICVLLKRESPFLINLEFN